MDCWTLLLLEGSFTRQRTAVLLFSSERVALRPIFKVEGAMGRRRWIYSVTALIERGVKCNHSVSYAYASEGSRTARTQARWREEANRILCFVKIAGLAFVSLLRRQIQYVLVCKFRTR